MKQRAFLIDNTDPGQCSLILSTYRSGIDYPKDFNRIIFGRLFMNHYMTILNYTEPG